MANYCDCDLYISGNEEIIKELLALVGAVGSEPAFNFDAIVPQPIGYLNSPLVASTVPGVKQVQAIQDWRYENWGCKANASDVAVDASCNSTGNVKITFFTPWSPPAPIFRALCKLYPTLSFSLEWFECGAEFMGGLRHEREWPVNEFVSWEGVYKGRRGG